MFGVSDDTFQLQSYTVLHLEELCFEGIPAHQVNNGVCKAVQISTEVVGCVEVGLS